jgi:hypothetical protein
VHPLHKQWHLLHQRHLLRDQQLSQHHHFAEQL